MVLILIKNYSNYIRFFLKIEQFPAVSASKRPECESFLKTLKKFLQGSPIHGGFRARSNSGQTTFP
jgi:hypothetical protein